MSRAFLFTKDSLERLGAAMADAVANSPGEMRMSSERVGDGVRVRIDWSVDMQPVERVAREIARDVFVLRSEP